MVQCIFGRVGPISRDFVDSNRALSNLHGMRFGFTQPRPISDRQSRAISKGHFLTRS